MDNRAQKRFTAALKYYLHKPPSPLRGKDTSVSCCVHLTSLDLFSSQLVRLPFCSDSAAHIMAEVTELKTLFWLSTARLLRSSPRLTRYCVGVRARSSAGISPSVSARLFTVCAPAPCSCMWAFVWAEC